MVVKQQSCRPVFKTLLLFVVKATCALHTPPDLQKRFIEVNFTLDVITLHRFIGNRFYIFASLLYKTIQGFFNCMCFIVVLVFRWFC